MTCYDLTKAVQFDEELRKLVQRYLHMSDPAYLETSLYRAAQEVFAFEKERCRWAKVKRLVAERNKKP